jgi:hypothetical protein
MSPVRPRVLKTQCMSCRAYVWGIPSFFAAPIGKDVRRITSGCAAADAAHFPNTTVTRRLRAGLKALPPQSGWFVDNRNAAFHAGCLSREYANCGREPKGAKPSVVL